MAQANIVQPGGQGLGVSMPDEGKLWRDNSGNIFTIQGGKILQVNMGDIVAQKYLGKNLNQLDMRPRGEGGTGEWDRLAQQLGISGENTLEKIGANLLGVDVSKLPEYSLGDVERMGGYTYSGQGLTGEEAKQLFTGGAIAEQRGENVALSAAETPKVITGGGGNVYDAQGNIIPEERYAEYGITNNQVAPTTVINGVVQGQTPSTEVLSGGQTITDPATGQVYQSSGANVGQPINNGQAPEQTPEATPTAGEVDMTGWSQAQIDAYNASKDYVDNLTKQGQVINPDIEINQSIIDKFQEQAKTELSPYYTQIFNQAKSDMERASKQLAESYGSQERNLGEQYGKALEGTQESWARKNLSDSTMRTGAERELATQATRSLEDLQKGTQTAAENIGIAGEREVGSANMPSLGSFNTGARPILGQAGVYGITPSSESRSLYTPQGGTTGTYEQERLTAEEQRKRDLIGSEREYRASAYL